MRRHCEKTPALSQVSIHASVKDATIGSAYIRARKDVSIHASVKDATDLGLRTTTELVGFNPRICKRCDLHNPYRQRQ